MKMQIESWLNGAVLFELATDSMRICVEAAVKSGANLSGANLYGANLSGANLSGADLSGANLSVARLSGADLSGADLSGADLSGANLYGANLYGANLYGADLSGANLYGANLSGANLSGARLYGANLYGANLSGANLSGARLYGVKNSDLAAAMTVIVPEGQIVGWKKLGNGAIAKLSIPADARRSNSTGRKCRAEFADVLEIIGAEDGCRTSNAPNGLAITYRAGIRVTPDAWDENRWNECSSGIHFYITRAEAEAQ